MIESLIKKFLHLNRTKKVRIHCVGDAMIDEYYDISVSRISPEYPIPIIHSNTDVCVKRPGAVANTAYQLKHFNTEVHLICFSDFEATKVFRDHHLLYSPCTTTSPQIPRKKRFLDGTILVKRWDVESANYNFNSEKLIEALNDSLTMTKNLEMPDVAILSDYNKGFFNPKQRRAWIERYKDCITIVDPKKGPLKDWKGCTVFKPNKQEAFELSGGLTDPQEQCDFFVKQLGCKVIITNGGSGLFGQSDKGFFKYNPEYCCFAESVVGAGDCFAAILGLTLAHGFELEECAKIAYEAGVLYVQNKMNRPICPAELSKDRLVEPEDLGHRDFKLVFANGVYDIVHSGHTSLLKFAKQKGDKLVVALNTDSSVKRLKGLNRPVMPLAERMAVMAAMRDVDFVVSFDEDTPFEAIKKCRPDVLVKGSDYTIKNTVGADIVKDVQFCPLVPNISTTKLLMGVSQTVPA